jgi:hypothetical protein
MVTFETLTLVDWGRINKLSNREYIEGDMLKKVSCVYVGQLIEVAVDSRSWRPGIRLRVAAVQFHNEHLESNDPLANNGGIIDSVMDFMGLSAAADVVPLHQGIAEEAARLSSMETTV